MVIDHTEGIARTIDRYTHSRSASITALISEQEDIRQLVEGLADRLDQSQGTSSAVQSEISTNVKLEISDLKTKALRLTEQNTQHDGRLTSLARMSEQVDLTENQIIKWRYRLPEMTDDDSRERVVSAVEVQEDLDEFKEVVLKKLKELLTNLNALQGEVRLLERDREESWEAVSHNVSTLVGDSVGALTERLSELEHTVQSRMTTPITEDGITQVEAWSTMEQAIMSELGKLRDYAQEVPRLYKLCEELHENQKSQEKQLTGLRSFAQHVERFLDQLDRGATAPSDSRQTPALERSRTSASRICAWCFCSARPPSYLQTPRPPTVPAPPVPKDSTPVLGENASSSELGRGSATHFSTVRSEVRSGAIRIDITNPEQWSAGDIAVLRNQEAKKVRDIGSLIFETPVQHNYEAGVEVRSLLSTEQLEVVKVSGPTLGF